MKCFVPPFLGHGFSKTFENQGDNSGWGFTGHASFIDLDLFSRSQREASQMNVCSFGLGCARDRNYKQGCTTTV